MRQGDSGGGLLRRCSQPRTRAGSGLLSAPPVASSDWGLLPKSYPQEFHEEEEKKVESEGKIYNETARTAEVCAARTLCPRGRQQWTVVAQERGQANGSAGCKSRGDAE